MFWRQHETRTSKKVGKVPLVVFCLFLGIIVAGVAETLYHYPASHKQLLAGPSVPRNLALTVNQTKQVENLHVDLYVPSEENIPRVNGPFCILQKDAGTKHVVDAAQLHAWGATRSYNKQFTIYRLTSQLPSAFWGNSAASPKPDSIAIRFSKPLAQIKGWLYISWIQERNTKRAVNVTEINGVPTPFEKY